MPRLVLWDIDKTLVDMGGLSGEIYRAAFRRATGIELRHVPVMAGRTDHDLALATFRAHGLEAPVDRLPAFYDALTEATRARAADFTRYGRCLPGAAEALTELAATAGVVQSVVTGNLRPVAELKLAAFSLTDHLDLDIGGYGSDDGERATLVRLAIRRAGLKFGAEFPAERTVVVGDTPYDIAGAKANGALAVAVATGSPTAADLRAAGPDLLLTSLADRAALVRLVTGS